MGAEQSTPGHWNTTHVSNWFQLNDFDTLLQIVNVGDR
jgi:hypothetical protein